MQLTRDPARARSTIIDLCSGVFGELALDTFEAFQLDEMFIDVPVSANAGENITVTCRVRGVSAPDSDRYPLSATLSEQGGRSISGPITEDTPVSEEFPDPFAASETSRSFTCTIGDGRSLSQTVQRTIARIPPTPTPTAVPTVTPTPIPLCLVRNENDSGSGSLRQVLADAPTNGCTTITFVPGVTMITLSTQLTIPPSMTLTIDGGSGVTISGNYSTRVFYVSIGAEVIFQNLTITQGPPSFFYIPYVSLGGGIYNDGGTVTVNGTVSNNLAYVHGGGIYNYGGTVTVNGTVSGNNAGSHGGGIYNEFFGQVDVTNATVTGNSANTGGGIYVYIGTVTGATASTVYGNTARDPMGCPNYSAGSMCW
jgi:hypothetical protein